MSIRQKYAISPVFQVIMVAYKLSTPGVTELSRANLQIDGFLIFEYTDGGVLAYNMNTVDNYVYSEEDE